MAMVVVDDSSLQADSQVAWSEGRRPLGAVLHSSNQPSEFPQWPCGHHDSTINIVLGIIIIIIVIIIHCELILLHHHRKYWNRIGCDSHVSGTVNTTLIGIDLNQTIYKSRFRSLSVICDVDLNHSAESDFRFSI